MDRSFERIEDENDGLKEQVEQYKKVRVVVSLCFIRSFFELYILHLQLNEEHQTFLAMLATECKFSFRELRKENAANQSRKANRVRLALAVSCAVC